MKNTNQIPDHITESGLRFNQAVSNLLNVNQQRKKAAKTVINLLKEDARPSQDLEDAIHDFILTVPVRHYRKMLTELMQTWLYQVHEPGELDDMRLDFTALYGLLQALERYELYWKYTRKKERLPSRETYLRQAKEQLDDALSLTAAAKDGATTENIAGEVHSYLECAMKNLDQLN